MSQASNEESAPPPPAIVLQMLTGMWISQAITTAIKLKLADELSKGPLSVARLAEQTSTNGRALLGLMRALASVGVFRELEDHSFGNTPLSDVLRSDVQGSLRSLALFLADRPTWNAWGMLDYTVRTGKSAFQQVHGELPYEYFAKRLDTCSYYDEAFTDFSMQERDAILRAMPFPDTGTLVDIGGGHGATLASILQKNPRQKGILFDQHHVVEKAQGLLDAFGVKDRCTIVEGNFFESVPAGADAYLIKHVLFNWNDQDATKILKTIRKAIPSTSRLFAVDPVIQPGMGQTFEKFMEVAMMVLHDGGCQRTEAEFAKLFAAGGFKLVRVIPTEAPSSILEAIPV